MAYADTIRSPTATMEQVATLIEGIGASTYPLNWTTWSPTYGASGSMTYTSVTTTYAKYIQIGKLILFSLRATGTTGGTASTDITFTAPVASAANAIQFAGQVFDTNYITAGIRASSTTVFTVRRFDSGNFGLGAGREILVSGLYEVP